jgi:hypothetical protein
VSDFFEIRDRLRKAYVAPTPEVAKALAGVRGVKGESIGEGGFLTEIAGRVILTAPASTVALADDLPKELAERWERASKGNPYMLWLQGRFVEAEKANRNGAFWSTEDLQFGEMSVKHGPLNWLHDEQTVVGTIADNALISPAAVEQAGVLDSAMPRPFMAAVSAVWRWVHPDKAEQIERAAGQGKLWYSMECVAREMSCVSDETHQGCGQSFDYIKAMTQPHATCEHIATRTSARRMVDPAFLGGAVILPPTQPGWGAANVELVRQAASLAEQTHSEAADMRDAEWQSLMEQVVRFATS